MDFIKKHWSNILFFGLIIFMFTPAGMPLRTMLIKGVSYITSHVENLEIDPDKRLKLTDYHWQLLDQNQHSLDLAEYKGKVVLINNWATWCPPCISEMPSLNRLYQTYKDQMVFLFVAHDKPEKVRQFLQKNHLNIPVVFVQSEIPSLLQSNSIPTTFILNKNGEIVVKKTGAVDWNSKQVHKILDQLIKSDL